MRLLRSINNYFTKSFKFYFLKFTKLQDFIKAQYLSEQLETKKDLADLFAKLKRIDLHRNGDALGLYIIDYELSAKFN